MPLLPSISIRTTSMPMAMARMRRVAISTFIFTLALILALSAVGDAASHRKVRLSDVQALTLHRNQKTTGRRSSPVPQLHCIGGNARGHYEPDVVQCRNVGFDGVDVQWKCEADLPNNLKFGELNVYCEGYEYPDDPFVLYGSCGLEYKLQYTQHHGGDSGFQDQMNQFNEWNRQFKKQSWTEKAFLGVWVIVVGFILYSFVQSCLQHSAQNPNDPPPPYRASGSGSSDHWGGGDDFGPGGGWGPGGGNNNNNNNNKPSGSGSQGYRPGFWSGLGLGSVMTYLASSNRNRPPREYYNNEYSNTYRSARPSTSWGSSFGGAGPSTFRSSASSSSSSSSSSRPASGYGGTRRR